MSSYFRTYDPESVVNNGSLSRLKFNLVLDKGSFGSKSYSSLDYIFQTYFVSIVSFELLEDQLIKIQFRVGYIGNLPTNASYDVNECKFTLDGINYSPMTPQTGGEHSSGPFVPDDTTVYTFIWNAGDNYFAPNVSVLINVTNGTVDSTCNGYSYVAPPLPEERSNIWSFGPGKEFVDFNAAMSALLTFYEGNSLREDQFLLGTPYADPYRNTAPMNPIPLHANGHKVIVASEDKNNRVVFTGREIIPSGTFTKEYENIEPTGPVWKTSFIQHYSKDVDVYEDQKLLIKVASINAVESTPGSYFIDGSFILHVHASDSSKLRINGKKYEATTSDTVFKWYCAGNNDKIKNLSFVDIDVEHSNEYLIDLEMFGTNYDSFNDLQILNCRFKTNYGAVHVNGAIGGITLKYNSFIDDNLIETNTDAVFLDNVRDDILFQYNYLKSFKDSGLLNLVSRTASSASVLDNIFINGNTQVSVLATNINIERNIFRRDNIVGATSNTIFSRSTNVNFIGNAVIGMGDGHKTINLNTVHSTVSLQNNTIWSDRGINQKIVHGTPSTLNFRLNLISLRGAVYDDAPGQKDSNVYLIASGTVPASDCKSRSDAYRNVFAVPLSYEPLIDKVNIIPVDDITKHVARRSVSDPQGIDPTGSATPCVINAGCVQTEGMFRNININTFRWPPFWVSLCAIPYNLGTTVDTPVGRSKNRGKAICELAALPSCAPAEFCNCTYTSTFDCLSQTWSTPALVSCVVGPLSLASPWQYDGLCGATTVVSRSGDCSDIAQYCNCVYTSRWNVNTNTWGDPKLVSFTTEDIDRASEWAYNGQCEAIKIVSSNGECTPPPDPTEVSITATYDRSGATNDCGVIGTIPYTFTVTLTLSGDMYVGTAPGQESDVGDTHQLTLRKYGSYWLFTGQLLPAGCGIENLVPESVAQFLIGTYPTAAASGPGNCGCPTIIVRYSNISVSAI